MTLLLNGAGGSLTDPILKGLPIKIVFASASFDVASVVDTWIEQSNNPPPGTSGSVKASLSPAATVLTAGVTGSYNDTSKKYTISSTVGLTVGDFLYLSHASLTAGIYKIAWLDPNNTDLTLEANPLDTLGNKTGISYQVAWSYTGNTSTIPIVSTAAGQPNYPKGRFRDAATQNGDILEIFNVKDAPLGSAFIAIGASSYVGGTVSTQTPSFTLLTAWPNKGGISHVELDKHSVQNVQDFSWGDDTRTEKTITSAETLGFSLTSGDGIKYGRILLKTGPSSLVLGIDISVTVDTRGPTIEIFLRPA